MAATVTPHQVILPARVWLSELAGELQRLGVVEPEAAARRTLQRILARAGWQRQFLVWGEIEPDSEEIAQ
jgi:hypothetical protein